jgi:uncharacterized protein YwqG
MEEEARRFIWTKLPRVAGEIEKLFRYSIRISTRSIDENELPIGASKIGGLPDLPDSIGWPEWKGLPLGFIAQINLSDVAALDKDDLLPKQGILYFFYDAKQSTWGFDPEDRGSFACFYFDGDATLLGRATRPARLSDLEGIYSSCALEFSQEMTLPERGSIYIDRLGLTSDPNRWRIEMTPDGVCTVEQVPISERPEQTNKEEEYYDDLTEMLDDWHGETVHRILGYPDPIQGDMQLECQLASNGIYCGNPADYESPQALELESGQEDWQLLLQIDTDENADMMWGDVGRIYYWIRRQDLERRDFDNIWMILQCS